MKIEKGKLYLYAGELEQCMSDGVVDDGLYSNKIAVHCPTMEDVEYLKSNLLDIKVDPFEDYYPDVYIQLDSPFTCCSKKGAVGLHYHIITIDQFKEFYPETNSESKETSIDKNERFVIKYGIWDNSLNTFVNQPTLSEKEAELTCKILNSIDKKHL